MAIVTKPHGDFVNNVDVANASYVDDQFNTLYNLVNGGLDRSNVPTMWGDNTLSNRSASLVNNNPAQALSAAVATKVVWQNVLTDYLSEFSAANSRFTAKNAGLYDLSGTLHFSGLTTGTTSITINLYKNGSLYALITVLTASNTSISVPFPNKLILASGEYVELYVTTNTTSTIVNGSYWTTVREA